MSKYIHRAKTLPAIPGDYYERWDASTSAGMKFATDEATGDITDWVGMVGNIPMANADTGADPVWTPGKVTFTEGNRCLRSSAGTASLEAASYTCFVVGQFTDTIATDNATIWRGPENNNRWSYDTGTADIIAFYHDGTGNETNPTNDHMGRVCVFTERVTYNGAADYDLVMGVGTTKIVNVSSVNLDSIAANQLSMGGSLSNGFTVDGHISEVIVYDRALSDAEMAAIIDYLSNKWSAQNQDAASLTISSAETVHALPGDYFARWDSTTSNRMTFNTDEATGDISTWVDMTGKFTLQNSVSGTTYPIWDPGAGVTFSNLQKCLYEPSTLGTQLTELDDKTYLVVAKAVSAATQTSTNFYMFALEGDNRVGWLSGNADPGVFDTAAFDIPSNSMDDTVTVWGARIKHNGTDDTDIYTYLGTDNLGSVLGQTDAQLAGATHVTLGGYGVANTFVPDCVVYEAVIYDRTLSVQEFEAAAKYLSEKWTAQLTDSASSDVASAGQDALVWSNKRKNDIEGVGQKLERRTPGHQTGEYSKTEIPERDVIYVPDNYPMATWGSAVEAYWDAAITGGMTFATGDAKAGGTVSAWTDVTGTYTMDTTTSGDSAVTFVPVHKGRPAMQGGTVASPASLETNANVTITSTNGNVSLYWAVVDWEDGGINQAPCGVKGNIMFPTTSAAGSPGDLSPLHENAAPGPYVGTSTGWENYGPSTIRNPIEGKHIFVWRVTINGTSGDVDSWYHGMKLPFRSAPSADATSFDMSVGALSTSNFDSEGGRMFEMGVADFGATGIGDRSVEDFIRYLCEKYNEDFMPDTTPMDIGIQARSTASVLQSDCCLWFRSDKNLTDTGWGLHPACAALHTSPGNFRLAPFADNASVQPYLGTKVVTTRNSTPVTSLVFANSYDFSETTDFPANDGGASSAHFLYHDSLTTTSSGAMCGTSLTYSRFIGASDTTLQQYASNSASNWANAGNAWVLIGASYLFDDDGTGGGIGIPGSVDGNSYHWKFNHQDAYQEADAAAASSFNTNFFVGSSSAGSLSGYARAAELFAWKHALQQRELDNLQKYLYYRYEFGNNRPVYLHEEDANTVAHWTYEADLSDNTGTKSALSGTYVAAGEQMLNRRQCHNHTAQTSGHSYAALDADLDTLGAFTWCAAVYITALPSASNWNYLVRSEPPAGGATAADNHRYTLRQEDDGTLLYIHQYGTKSNETYSSNIVVPLNQWVYVGVTRAADGLSGRIIVDDTIEEMTFANAPASGTNCRFEMWEGWDGDDFDGYASTAIFKSVETSAEGLIRMRRQVFPFL